MENTNIDTSFLIPVEGNPQIDSYIGDVVYDYTDTSAWHALGYHYDRENMPDLALRCYETVLQLDPEKVITHNNLGSFYQGRKDYDLAIDHYQKAVSYRPGGYPRASLNLGRLYANLGKSELALISLEDAVRADPDYKDAWMSLGFYYLKFGKPEKAFHATCKAIELGELPISYLNKAHVHLIWGDEQQALEDYARSKRAFNSERAFWKDYWSDYDDVVENYDISREYYHSLTAMITERETTLAEFGLPEIAGKWAHCRVEDEYSFSEEQAAHLRELGYPESFILWLKIANIYYYSYDLVSLDEDYKGFMLIDHTGIGNRLKDDEYDLLFENGFLPFCEDYRSSVSAFDKHGRVWQIRSETYEACMEKGSLTTQDFEGDNFDSFASFLRSHFEKTRPPKGDFIEKLKGRKLEPIRDAIKSDADNYGAWGLLGKELKTKRKPEPELALKCFMISLSINPDYGPSNYEIGKYCMETGKYIIAVKYFSKAVNFEPANGDYHFALGDLFTKLGNHREAERSYQKGRKAEADAREAERWMEENEE